MLQTVIETLLFYHPAVWWLSRAIRQEREQCCDDLAAEVCGDRVLVAKALVRLAEVRALPATAAMAATRGRLAQRVRRLLTAPRSARESTPLRTAAGSFVACLTASLVVMAFVVCSGGLTDRPAFAQESRPQPNDSHDSTGRVSNETTPKDQSNDPMSHVPFLSRLYTKAAADDSANDDQHVKAVNKFAADPAQLCQDRVKLLEAPISLEYRDTQFDTVLDEFREKAKMSIMVDESALKRLDVSPQLKISVRVRDLAVKDALQKILRAADPRLVYEVKEDYLFVTAPDKDMKTATGGPATPNPNVDRLNQQLQRLEQQNEETRRELLKLEEQLKADQKSPRVESPLRRATDADVRLARLYQLQNEEQAESKKLAGTWKVVGLHSDGGEQPVSHAQTWEFRGHEVAVDTNLDSANKRDNDDRRSHTYFVNPMKSPKEMTIFGKNILIQAIYKVEDDTLTICFFGRSEVDRPNSFKPAKDDVLPHTVLTLRRADHAQTPSF